MSGEEERAKREEDSMEYEPKPLVPLDEAVKAAELFGVSVEELLPGGGE